MAVQDLEIKTSTEGSIRQGFKVGWTSCGKLSNTNLTSTVVEYDTNMTLQTPRHHTNSPVPFRYISATASKTTTTTLTMITATVASRIVGSTFIDHY